MLSPVLSLFQLKSRPVKGTTINFSYLITRLHLQSPEGERIVDRPLLFYINGREVSRSEWERERIQADEKIAHWWTKKEVSGTTLTPRVIDIYLKEE